jgi:hypothetical protein
MWGLEEMMATFLIATVVATAVVWMLRVRPRTLLALAAAAAMSGAVLLLLSPTPRGYSEQLDSDRPGGEVVAGAGPPVAGVLFGLAAACVLGAALGSARPRPTADAAEVVPRAER